MTESNAPIEGDDELLEDEEPSVPETIIEHLATVIAPHQSGRTTTMLGSAAEAAGKSPRIFILAANMDHAARLADAFFDLADEGKRLERVNQRQVNYNGTSYTFTTPAEEARVTERQRGALRFVDHFTIEDAVRRLCRETVD